MRNGGLDVIAWKVNIPRIIMAQKFGMRIAMSITAKILKLLPTRRSISESCLRLYGSEVANKRHYMHRSRDITLGRPFATEHLHRVLMVKFAPAESSRGGISGLMKQYGGLASLAGVSLPGGEEGSRTQLGIELMKSRAFIGDFLERHDILPELMALSPEGRVLVICSSTLKYMMEQQKSGSEMFLHRNCLGLLGRRPTRLHRNPWHL